MQAVAVAAAAGNRKITHIKLFRRRRRAPEKRILHCECAYIFAVDIFIASAASGK